MEVDPAPSEPNSFPLEEQPLTERAAAVTPPTHRSAAVDDAVPGYTRRAHAHGLADGPGGAGRSYEHRDLAVGHHSPDRDPADQGVDALLEATGHARAAASAARPFPVPSGPNWSSQRVRYSPSRRSSSAWGPSSTR